MRKNYWQFGQTTTIYSSVASKNQVTSLESHPLLLSQAKNLYMNALKKFPKYCALKIDFAIFLLHKMHNKKEALRELMNAEKANPTLEQQFLIYRFRHIIEDELHEGIDVSGGGLDYVAAVNFENHFNSFKQAIERSSVLHYEFWNHLLDDNPDLARLSAQGTKINQSIQQVEDRWKKLGEQSTQTPKALRLYASYLIEILNDREMGNEQLMKAKEAAILRANFDYGNLQEDVTDMSSFSSDGTPCVYISGEQERLGQIVQCNMSVCRVFGYAKKEDIVNKEVEMLMPKIYAKNHKKFLEAAIQKPPDLLSNKERPVFGKHYSGYIFPLWLQIKNLTSFLSGRQFVATFKVEKSYINKNVAHLILDKNKEVIDISSSCMTMLDINQSKLLKKKAKFDINILMPTLFGANYYQFVNKQGCQIEYFFPEFEDLSKKVNAENEGSNNNRQDEQMLDALGGQEQDGEYLSINGGKNYATSSLRGKPLGTDQITDFGDDNYQGQDSRDIASIVSQRFKKYRRNGGDQMEQDEENEMMEDEDEENFDEEELGNQYEFRLIASNTKSCHFQCNLVELHFETQNIDNPNPGYYIRLETISEMALQKQLELQIKNSKRSMPYSGQDGHEKNTQVQKIPKNIKNGAFQFSYDPIYRRFQRELRDKENKEIFLDKNYLSLKKIKDTFNQQKLKQPENFPTKSKLNKIINMTYLNYLNRYQKWVEKGSVGNIIDENMSDDSSDNSEDENDENKEENKNKGEQGKGASLIIQPQNQFDVRADIKKYIPGEGSGKEFLKQEIEKMMDILRKKHEIGIGVHLFRKLEVKGQLQNQFEEVQPQLASLFTQRQSDRISSEMDDDQGQKEEEEKDKGKNDSFKNNIKSRKAFQMAMNDKTMPSSIVRLSRIANFVLLCLISFAVADYSVIYKQIQSTIVQFNQINNSYLMAAEIQKVCFNIRTLLMLNSGAQTNYYGFSNKTEFFGFVQKDLQESLNLLYYIQNSINLAKVEISAAHDEILNQKSINLKFKEDLGTSETLKFSLTQAILQIQSSIFTVSNMALNQFLDSNQDIFFIIQNSFDDFYSSLITSSNLYVVELIQRSDDKIKLSLILFISSIAALLLISLTITPVVQSVNKQKDKVLSLFCEIDDYHVRVLLQRCERFLNKVQQEELHDEMESNDDGEGGMQKDDDDDYGLLSGVSKRTKRAKNLIKTQKSFYMKFIFVVLIIEAYYVYNYAVEKQYINKTQILGKELNISSASEPFYWLMLNSQRELFYDSNRIILGQQALNLSITGIIQMYELNNEMQLMHLQDQAYLSQTFEDTYQQIMNNDTCPQIKAVQEANTTGSQYFTNVSFCEGFISGSTRQGMASVIVRYFETLKLTISNYEVNKTNFSRIQNGTNATIRAVPLINSYEMFELYLIQHDFTQTFYRKLCESLRATIVDEYDVLTQRRIFLLIFFLIIILFLYVTIWVPLVSNLNNEIYKTKLMLMIIPLEILMRMKNVGKVLQSQNFIQEKARSNGKNGSNSKGGGGGSDHNNS